MRMIDADKLLSMIGNANGNVSCAVLTEYINTLAKDVIHGHWVTTKSIDNEYFQMCDACQRMASVRTNFCPNCGADMRGYLNRTLNQYGNVV